MPAITELMPDDIVVRDRLRELNPDIVERLKESIGRIGLKTPLSVRFLNDDDGYQLVTGRHRLQAAIELGIEWVPVREETGSELDARMWEIAENLHRAELTALERDTHITEWIALVDQREAESVSAQVAPKLSARGRAGEGRPQVGINAASRELGIERTAAQRAVAVGKLAPEAKDEAIALGLDNNHSALRKAAKHSSKEDQIRALREHAAWLNAAPAGEAAAQGSQEPGNAADSREGGKSENHLAAAPIMPAAGGDPDVAATGKPARQSWKPSSLLDFNLDTDLLREAIAEVKAWRPNDLDYQIEERILDAMGAPRRCDLTPLADLDHAVAIVPAEWRIVTNLAGHAFGGRQAVVKLIKGETRIEASAAYAAVAVTETALRAWLFEITGEPAP
jgi:ParB-like chromosome segregation protein Spo0J